MINRRDLLRRLTGGAAAATAMGPLLGMSFNTSAAKSRINHSVCRWPYGGMALDELARKAKALGIASVELLDPEEIPLVQEHGLTCGMVNAPTPIERGFNHATHHDDLQAAYDVYIRRTAQNDVNNLICFSGNRDGMSDQEGIANCVAGIEPLLPLAEEHGVVLFMEILNSKVDHADYHFDHMAFGAEVAARLNSDHFRILYDIYHAQIMEGDVMRTIRDYAEIIGHYHTGGVPGRNEIDETQELHYPAIMRAIADTGFRGWVGQEFIPTAVHPMRSLAHAIHRCTV